MKKEDHNSVPDSVLTKEFLSQFKTEDDVSKFLTKLHAPLRDVTFCANPLTTCLNAVKYLIN